MSSYRPGRCNIGPRQRRRRTVVAAAAALVAVGYVSAYVVGVIPRAILPAVFVPLTFAFEWAIQAYDAFCVRLAVLNRYNFRGNDDSGQSGHVTDPGHVRADHVQAAKITAASIGLAAVTTLLIVVVLG